ncbi:HARBI1 [Mytilus coruscus]|uniref:HARBI1 n=1 Tax=Mytilus coruscus TaxID=42192 RepID=A0A6J8CES5_MYTCO|nr:HARBI1 [Mytilus coruscus]
MTENEKEILSFELHEEDRCITNQRSNFEEKSTRLEHRNKNVDSRWAWVVLAVKKISMQINISVVSGIAFALLHGPVSYLIGVYFVKRRNLAQSISGAGFGLGGLIFPPIYTYIIEKYGLRGGLLITGGVQLNIVAFALLLRPLSNNGLKDRETKCKNPKNNENMTANKAEPETPVSPEELQNLLNKKQIIEENFDFKEKNEKSNYRGGHMLNKVYKQEDTEKCKISCLKNTFKDSYSPNSESKVCSGTRKSFLNRLLQWLTVIVDYTLFKHWFMRVYIGVFCVGCIGVIYNVIYIAPFAKDNNISVNDVAILVSIVNTCDFVGRIMNGVITDRQILKNYQSVILTSSITAISMVLAPLYTKYWHFVVYGVISGLSAGCLFALTPAIIGDFLGMENFRSAMGILMFGEGITSGLAAPFIDFSDEQLRQRYRFGRETIEFLANELRGELERSTSKKAALSVERQVMIALRFYGSGSQTQVVGDTMGYDKSTVSRVVSDVTDALVARKEQYIKWPTEVQKNVNKRAFYDKAGFPNIIGCIDGPHVHIQAPTEDEPTYVNRKGFHSVNVQVICDHQERQQLEGILKITIRALNKDCCWVIANIRVDPSCLHHTGNQQTECRNPLTKVIALPDLQWKEYLEFGRKGSTCLWSESLQLIFELFMSINTDKNETRKSLQDHTTCEVLHNIAILKREPDVDGEHEVDIQPIILPYVGRQDGQGIRDNVAIHYFS